jgi:hypothetical protein
VWDAIDGTCIAICKTHDQYVSSIFFSGDEREHAMRSVAFPEEDPLSSYYFQPSSTFVGVPPIPGCSTIEMNPFGCMGFAVLSDDSPGVHPVRLQPVAAEARWFEEKEAEQRRELAEKFTLVTDMSDSDFDDDDSTSYDSGSDSSGTELRLTALSGLGPMCTCGEALWRGSNDSTGAVQCEACDEETPAEKSWSCVPCSSDYCSPCYQARLMDPKVVSAIYKKRGGGAPSKGTVVRSSTRPFVRASTRPVVDAKSTIVDQVAPPAKPAVVANSTIVDQVAPPTRPVVVAKSAIVDEVAKEEEQLDATVKDATRPTLAGESKEVDATAKDATRPAPAGESKEVDATAKDAIRPTQAGEVKEIDATQSDAIRPMPAGEEKEVEATERDDATRRTPAGEKKEVDATERDDATRPTPAGGGAGELATKFKASSDEAQHGVWDADEGDFMGEGNLAFEFSVGGGHEKSASSSPKSVNETSPNTFDKMEPPAPLLETRRPSIIDQLYKKTELVINSRRLSLSASTRDTDKTEATSRRPSTSATKFSEKTELVIKSRRLSIKARSKFLEDTEPTPAKSSRRQSIQLPKLSEDTELARASHSRRPSNSIPPILATNAPRRSSKIETEPTPVAPSRRPSTSAMRTTGDRADANRESFHRRLSKNSELRGSGTKPLESLVSAHPQATKPKG